MYHIQILNAASRDLERLDQSVGRRIIQRIRWLAVNVERVPLEALSGSLKGLYKLRIGDYRVIYEVIHAEECLIIHAIRHRRDVYRSR